MYLCPSKDNANRYISLLKVIGSQYRKNAVSAHVFFYGLILQQLHTNV